MTSPSSPVPPYLKRAMKNDKDKGHAGKKAEGSLAHRLRATLQPGSGALAGAKGDMKKGQYLIESKTAVGESFTLRHEWLRKIYQEALETGMTPAMAVTFVDHLGKSERNGRWIMIPESVFNELVGD